MRLNIISFIIICFLVACTAIEPKKNDPRKFGDVVSNPSIPNNRVDKAIPNYSQSSYCIIAKKIISKTNSLERKGMGVIIGKQENKYFLLTNKHIVEHSDTLSIFKWTAISPNLNKKNYVGTIVYMDKIQDLALISFVSSENYNVATPALNNPSLTSEIMLFGHLSNSFTVVSKGIVSGYWRTPNGILTISDATTSPGFSGSGAFNKQKNLVGIITGKTRDDRKGFAYIIPIKTIISCIRKAGFFPIILHDKKKRSIAEPIMKSKNLKNTYKPHFHY